MLPLYDETPHRRTPVVVVLLITACVVVMGYEHYLWKGASEARLAGFVDTWGLMPARMRPGVAPETWWTTLTHMFLHGGWGHLAGNCWFLWLFGNNIEDRLGHVRFVFFYLLSGLGAAGAQFLFGPNSADVMIGASGAISGVLGAYLRYYPKSIIITLTPIWFAPLLPIPAFIFILIWFGFQIWNGIGEVTFPSMSGGVAWWAHVGGFLAGYFLAGPFAPGRKRASS
ncbi:MAG: rhomboid family intramembrane serine protease [Opitutaceae bacterium]|nr:rhomboid family intramembrane serine protease [Opitutaceae bacterium]